jgi:hypothetical protein
MGNGGWGYGAPLGYAQPSGMWSCRHCGHAGTPLRESKATTAAWIVALVLSLSCVGLLFCWVPLVTMKQTTTLCPRCRTPAGTA